MAAASQASMASSPATRHTQILASSCQPLGCRPLAMFRRSWLQGAKGFLGGERLAKPNMKERCKEINRRQVSASGESGNEPTTIWEAFKERLAPSPVELGPSTEEIEALKWATENPEDSNSFSLPSFDMPNFTFEVPKFEFEVPKFEMPVFDFPALPTAPSIPEVPTPTRFEAPSPPPAPTPVSPSQPSYFSPPTAIPEAPAVEPTSSSSILSEAALKLTQYIDDVVITQADSLAFDGQAATLPKDTLLSLESFLRSYAGIPEAEQYLYTGIFVLVFAYLTIRPGVLAGFFDAYVLLPIDLFLDYTVRRQFKVTDFVLGSRLGEGSFGTVFLAAQLLKGSEDNVTIAPGRGRRQPLMKELKETDGVKKVILKKMKLDRNSIEHGEAEDYICRRMRRAAPNAAANYLGNFQSEIALGQFVRGQQCLVWEFEGQGTLADYLKAGDYPENIERALFGKELSGMDDISRLDVVTKKVMRQIFISLSQMHAIGIVHRDIKPLHFVVTDNGGRLKMIDFGAATDLRIGKYYIPEQGILDPDYCPPEQLVMPEETPKPPPAPVAAALSPMLWLFNHPDRFDTYSAGIIMLQLACPQLRNTSGLRVFNKEIAKYDWDLRDWRDSAGQKYDFSVLDLDNRAGWDLVCRLVCPKGEFLGGRLSAEGALRHRYFLSQSDRIATVMAKISA